MSNEECRMMESLRSVIYILFFNRQNTLILHSSFFIRHLTFFIPKRQSFCISRLAVHARHEPERNLAASESEGNLLFYGPCQKA